MFWWHHATFWVNALLLPIYGLYFACLVSFHRDTRWSTASMLVAINTFGLHIHSTAGILLPVTALALLWLWRAGAAPSSRSRVAFGAGAMVAACAPYVVAELSTDFGNTRAILDNIERGSAQSEVGLESAREVVGLLRTWGGAHPYPWLGSCFVAAWVAWCATRVSRRDWSTHSLALFLSASAVVTGLSVFAFFVETDRAIASPHYQSVFLYSSVLPAALVLRWILLSLGHARSRHTLAAGLVALCVAAGYRAHSQWHRESLWSFQNIRSILVEACRDASPLQMTGTGLFRAYRPGYPNVLEYLASTHVPSCRLAPGGPHVLHVRHDGPVDETMSHDGASYALEKTYAPRAGLYRRR